MKKPILCFAVLMVIGPRAGAQDSANIPPSTFADLSGDWRMSADDRPEYASPRFDDRGWGTLTLPRGSKYFFGIPYWLRRNVELPESPHQEPLALTLGTLQDVYEIYVNGVRIGATGNFQSFGDAQIPRARTFDLPDAAVPSAGPLVIAIHIRGALFFHPFWRLPDTGPYLLTARALAPRDAGRRQLERRWVNLAPDLFFSAIFIVIGVLSLLAWLSERNRGELLWFALVSVARALASMYLCLGLLADGHPFTASGTAPELVLGNLHVVLFVEFVFAALQIRSWKLRAALWAGWSAAPVALLWPGFAAPWLSGFLALGWVSGLGLFAILRNWWRVFRRGATREEHALRCVVFLFSLNQCITWVQLLLYNAAAQSRSVKTYGMLTVDQGTEPMPVIAFGPYRAQYDHIFWLFVSVTILTLLLRRLVADRRERQRLSDEMGAARVVQQLLLKKPEVQNPELIVDAVYIPAQEVGGDFYYVLDGQLVIVGDVSGKGLKAAMLVSLITGVLRETTQRTPSGVLSSLNHALAGQMEGGFVTCCCAGLDAEGSVLIANAGHPAPYVDGREVEVEAGLPLGIVACVDYAETYVRGGQFTFVSDGVVEAENTQRELFGFDRTRDISTQSARQIADAAKAWGQNDDITVVTVRRQDA